MNKFLPPYETIKGIMQAQTKDVPLCKNCMHFDGGRCLKVKSYVDLVYGNDLPKSCIEVRSTLGECGPGGFLFEPKGN